MCRPSKIDGRCIDLRRSMIDVKLLLHLLKTLMVYLYANNCAEGLHFSAFMLLEISRRTRWWCLKCVIVYRARDIPPFVMYCVNGKPRSSLLIESTNSMILLLILLLILQWTYRDSVLSSDARLHVNPIHFLARRAVC